MVRNLLFRCALLVLVMGITAPPGFSQTPFFTEDFANNIPGSWVRKNLNGNSPGAIWTWCSQHLPTGQPLDGCPLVFNDLINKQGPFGAASATNGFAVFDSDFFFFNGIFTHNSILQTHPIDCTDKDEVWLKFETHIGVFTLPTKDNAVIEVSTDSSIWTSFNFIDLAPIILAEPNPGISGWSLNPHFAIIDISSVAANQSKVFIRWRWDGESEYYWAIDDVALFDEDPSPLFIPDHDIRLTNFYAIAPNLVTPISQVESFGFLADIKNDGLADQTNTTIQVVIRNTTLDEKVFSGGVNIGKVERDSLVQNYLIPGDGYLPDKIGNYVGTYSVNADSMDQKPSNNTRLFPFSVSQNTFAKEDGILSYTAPDDSAWPNGANKSWGWGNSYYCPKGDLYKATSIDFSIQGQLAELAGNTLRVALYQWTDLNGDQDCQENERFLDPTAFVDYTITGLEEEDQFISVDLNDGMGIPLNDDGEYIAMLEFEAPPGDNILEIAYNNNYNYGGMFLRSDSIMDQKYASFLWLGVPNNTDFSSFGFGFSLVPCVRLNIAVISDLKNITLSPDNQLKLYPNPARDQLTIDLKLVDRMPQAALELIGTGGQLYRRMELEGVKEERLEWRVHDLPDGIYFLRLRTPEGVLTQRFLKM